MSASRTDAYIQSLDFFAMAVFDLCTFSTDLNRMMKGIKKLGDL